MTRELRLRCAGLLFYITLAVSLLLTDKGIELLGSFPPNDVGWFEALIALLGAGILVFTSDAVGFLFNSVAFAMWNERGKMGAGFGYANEWTKLSYDLKSEVVQRFAATSDSNSQRRKHGLFEERWKDFSPDVFLSYFWQQAPRRLVDWVSRRHTAYFMGRSATLAISSGIGASIAAILRFGMGWTAWHICIYPFWTGMIIFMSYNYRAARVEALQMIDLWLADAFDPKIRGSLTDIMSRFSGKGGTYDAEGLLQSNAS